MIRRGSPHERAFLTLVKERYPSCIAIRSAGSLLTDVVLIFPHKTVLVEVKSCSNSTFYASKNSLQKEQRERILEMKGRGFNYIYAVWFLRRGWRFFDPEEDPLRESSGVRCLERWIA